MCTHPRCPSSPNSAHASVLHICVHVRTCVQKRKKRPPAAPNAYVVHGCCHSHWQHNSCMKATMTLSRHASAMEHTGQNCAQPLRCLARSITGSMQPHGKSIHSSIPCLDGRPALVHDHDSMPGDGHASAALLGMRNADVSFECQRW